jgi:hypothetical protein
VRLKIPVEDRCSTDNKRMFCRAIEVKQGNRYALQCEYGILHGFYRTKNMDRLTSNIPHRIPPFEKGSHRELTLREAPQLQSPAEFIQLRCRCKGDCTTVRCKSFKAKAECTVHWHGRDGGAQCTNTGASAAPSGTFHLERNARSDPPASVTSRYQKRRRANTHGDASTHTDPTSVEDIANESSDLTELDTEDEEVLEEEEVTGEEEQEEEEEENEDNEAVSNDDMEHSVIVVASGRPRRIRL